MIEQNQHKLHEIARDILDLEMSLDESSDPRAQGELLMAIDHLKEHTRLLYEALVVMRHELADFNQTNQAPIFEPSTEKIKDIVAQMPPETQQVDDLFEHITDGSQEAQEVLSHYQEEIEFEPVHPVNVAEEAVQLEPKAAVQSVADHKEETPFAEEIHTEGSTAALKTETQGDLNSTTPKPKSVNDRWGRLSVGLNDRTAFVQHLFLGDVEGFNRVLSQINTFETLDEVNDFLRDQVTPEYNNWEGKEAVADRLMRLVQQRFNA